MGTLANTRILVVDDDELSVRLVQAVLEGEGCDLAYAVSGESALQLIEKAPPDLVVLDLLLPGMSGLELARRLKAKPETRGTVIVAVTASNGPRGERNALEAGCSAYVRKPIDTSRFAQQLAAHLPG